MSAMRLRSNFTYSTDLYQALSRAYWKALICDDSSAKLAAAFEGLNYELDGEVALCLEGCHQNVASCPGHEPLCLLQRR